MFGSDKIGGDHGLLERGRTAPAYQRAGARKTGVDWPELRVGDIQKSMTSTTVFYWATKEEVGKRWHQKQLELTDEEAAAIGVALGL